MKFEVQSKAFYAAAAAVSKVIASKNALLILDNFLIDLHDGQLTLTGSDSDCTLSATVELSSSEGSGKICLSARKMLSLLKELPDVNIQVEINDATLDVDITYQDGKFSLVGLGGSEFPEYKPASDGGETASITTEGSRIVKALEYTLFAVATEDFRAQMQGVYFDIFEDHINVVATDTRKLVRYTDNNIKPGVTASFILPPKAASVVRSVFADAESLTIDFNSRNATFSDGVHTFKCSFMNGRYPDYERVIPKKNPLHLTADRVSMLNLVRRVSICVDAGYGLIKFRFTPDSMLLKTSDSGMCTAGRDKMSCSFSGTELTIGFGSEHIMAILNALPGNDVNADLSDPGRPGVFYPSENAEGTDLIMLLMPMTVSEF